jgi:DNA-binding transcriptional MocR family regulator
MQDKSRPYKYEQLADETAQLIQSGTFRPGDRIPSIRQMSRRKQVSISTVMQAYSALEARGLIETRPRSGIYVRTSLPRLMPEPRISSPELDPTQVTVWEMVRMVLRDARHPDLVQLGAAYPDPDLLAAGKLIRLQAGIVRRKGEKCGMYDLPPKGSLPLRVQIAQRAAASGCRISPDDLVITDGCTEAVSLCLRAVCRPGDIVAIESPICFDVLQSIEVLELRALEIPTHPHNGISLETLGFAIEHNPVRACIVISNFNNPLGSCIPEDRKQALVAMLARHDIPLIENDIFGEIYFGTERPGVAKSYDRKGLVMLCSSFSKTLCPGCRVGWVAGGRFTKRIEWLKYTSTMVTATLPQLALAEFIAAGACEHHLRRIRRIYERRVAAMVQAVERCFPEGTGVTRPTGGFLLWLQLPDNVNAFELYTRALKSGIAIAPGLIFSSSDHYRNFIRLNAANWSDGAEASIETLGRLAASMA